MHSNDSNGSRVSWARGFMAPLAIVLAMGLALAACPAEAAPFAYVTNSVDKHGFGDRHGHQHGGGHGRGGV